MINQSLPHGKILFFFINSEYMFEKYELVAVRIEYEGFHLLRVRPPNNSKFVAFLSKGSSSLADCSLRTLLKVFELCDLVMA